MSSKTYVTIFFYPLVILLLLIFAFEIAARKMPNVYGYKNYAIESNNNKYKALILGSSHSYYGINPDHIVIPTLNAANVSQSLKYDRYILEKSLKTLSELDYVIIPLSAFTLYNELESGVESWRKYSYRHWFGFKQYPFEEYFDIRTHSVVLASPRIPSLLERVLRYSLLDEFYATWSKKGWGKDYLQHASYSRLKDSGKAAALRHQRNTEINMQAVSHLEEVVKMCIEKDIKLLIVTLPAYATYREQISNNRIMETTKIATELSRNHKNVKYVNYFGDDRFISSDYFDADHLNHDGARKFSNIVSHVLEEWED